MFSRDKKAIEDLDLLFKYNSSNNLMDACNSEGDSYLIQAVKQSKIEHIYYYAGRGVPMSGQNSSGDYPLSVPLIFLDPDNPKNFKKVLKALVVNGAEIDDYGKNLKTVLLILITEITDKNFCARYDLMKYIFEKGCFINRFISIGLIKILDDTFHLSIDNKKKLVHLFMLYGYYANDDIKVSYGIPEPHAAPKAVMPTCSPANETTLYGNPFDTNTVFLKFHGKVWGFSQFDLKYIIKSGKNPYTNKKCSIEIREFIWDRLYFKSHDKTADININIKYSMIETLDHFMAPIDPYFDINEINTVSDITLTSFIDSDIIDLCVYILENIGSLCILPIELIIHHMRWLINIQKFIDVVKKYNINYVFMMYISFQSFLVKFGDIEEISDNINDDIIRNWNDICIHICAFSVVMMSKHIDEFINKS